MHALRRIQCRPAANSALLLLLCLLPSFTWAHAADSAGAPAISYHVIHSRFSTPDTIVASYTDADWNLDRTGKMDDAPVIQQALDAISAAGGGTLFLSSGTYRLDSPLNVKPGVTLRGEIGTTSDPYRYQGTILAAYPGRGQEAGAPLITLNTSTGVRDCIIWYPEQNPDSIVPYPPAVDHNSSTTSVQNVVFVNAYQAYRSGYSMSGRAYVRSVRGTALSVGIEVDGLADTGRVEDVHLSPEYWAHSGLPGAPHSGDDVYRQFMLSNGVGVLERRIDWTNTADIDINGYNKGFYATYSKNEEDLKKGHLTVSPNGENYDYIIRNCTYGVYLDCTANSGLMFTHFDIQATTAGFYLGDQCVNTATLLDDTVDCPGQTLENHGTGRLLIRDCRFKSGGWSLPAGVVDCVSSDFSRPSCHLEAGDALTNASFFGDTFAIPLDISGTPAAQSAVHVVSQPVPPGPKYDAIPIDFSLRHGPALDGLYVVTSPEFGAVGDGTTDCTKALQSALAKAGSAHGGIVLVPTGAYLVTAPLVIPAGVELRGVFGGPHDAITEGSCILVSAGQGDAQGSAFITMQRGSSLNGLNFHYPGQDMANIVDFPFLVRGEGTGITITNIASDNVSHFIDLMTHRCDDAYVDHIEGQPIHVGLQVGGGSRNVTVTDCQFNPSNWTFSKLFNAPKVVYATDNVKRSAVVDAYTEGMQEHGQQFILGDCSNLKFYRNLDFARRNGHKCVAEHGRGPSGVCLGLGVDGSTTALRIDAIGSGGFPLIDSQLVVTSKLTGLRHDVELGKDFTGNAELYGANIWGGRTDASVQILGGTLRLDGAHLRDPGNPALDVEGGNLTITASCIRRNAAILPANLMASSKIVSDGNILPGTEDDAAGIDSKSNLSFTDPDSVRK